MRLLLFLLATPWIAALWLPTGASAALQINSNFDGGSIGPYFIDDVNDEIDFSVLTDALNYTYWAQFIVSGAESQERRPRSISTRRSPS